MPTDAQIKTQGPASSVEVYWDMRDRLITAEFAPGEKLKPEALRLRYGCAASTVREVLHRLASDRFADFQDQRGFRVPRSSRTLLAELVHYRLIVEREGAVLSTRLGDLEWRAELSAAHHRLDHIESEMRGADDIAPYLNVWCACEWRFHLTLISACGSATLIENYRDVYDRQRMHLVMAVESHGYRPGNIVEHKAILDAVLARDEAEVAKRVEAHLNNGLTQLAVITEDEGG